MAYKIKRLSPGNYQLTHNNIVFDIWRFEEGSCKGEWIVTTNRGKDYSDPIPTYREAKLVALNWGVN